eukprot:Hpha_TRINITY_DN15673_c3_g1::TRINITY_DN15673_c3_g1_i1::g.97975::m.97975
MNTVTGAAYFSDAPVRGITLSLVNSEPNEESIHAGLVLVLGRVVGLLLLGLGGLLGLLGLVVSRLLGVLGLAPGVGDERVHLLERVGDDDVVEDRARLHLPQVDTDTRQLLGAHVQVLVLNVLGVGDALGRPHTLVRGVRDTLGLPLALELRVRDLGGLPGTVVLLIPVLRLLGLRVRDRLRLVAPVRGLRVLGVVHLSVVHPVTGLRVRGVVDLLRLQERPVLLEGSGLLLLTIDLHLVGAVVVDDRGVHVVQAVVHRAGLLLPQQVLALVVKDQVDLLGVTADVGTEHHPVRRLTVELLRLERLLHHLDVTTTAVDALGVLQLERHDDLLVLVVHRLRDLRRDRVELRVLGGLQTLVGLGVAEELARSVLELSVVVLLPGHGPAVAVRPVEGLLEEHLCGDPRREGEESYRPHVAWTLTNMR